ncbi:hypothetical protein JTE90_020957 [Oedothorax gibbosus]|uniref:Uncharacterized protein n=1 Tax=Oedothorax gibbosus TaxID=931172 RepID=A0AAV6U7F2_9ARAC|nr:hypothetical protein JTE90_020957 [Oedothorax gibbosus]
MLSDVTHLVLYNLSVIHNKTYFDLDTSILPFLVENWLRFHFFGPITTVKDADEIRGKILDVLLHDGRFKSGREVKKSKNIFGLRNRIPPEPPTVEPVSAKVKKDILIWEFHVKERPYHFLTSTKPKKSTKNGKTRKKFPISTPSKQNEATKFSEDPLHQENSIQKAKNRVKKTTTPFTEKTACVGLLDSLIPILTDFTAENNPFLKSREKRAAKRQSILTPKEKTSDLVGVVEKAPASLPVKRKFNRGIQNGNHKQSNGKKHLEKATTSSPSDSELFFDAKDHFSEDSPMGKNGIRVMGKRVTRTGKVQYLFQKDR